MAQEPQAALSVCAVAGLVFAIAAFPASAQPAATPDFEAVEFRVAKALPPGAEVNYSTNALRRLVQIRTDPRAGLPQVTPVFGSSGRVVMQAATLRQLIGAAYPEVLGKEYLTGGPPWIDSDRFDLIAKAPPNTSADTERQMIQTVLARRFHLRVHTQATPMPVYALARGSKESKLRPAAPSGDPSGCRPHGMTDSPSNGIHYSCRNMTMTQLAEWLPYRASGYIDLPVVDLTGLESAYDFPLDWSPRMPGADSPAGMTIFDAVEKGLGLKLEQRKYSMPIVVIDRVDRTPADN